MDEKLQRIQKLIAEIDKFLNERQPKVTDCMTAMTALVAARYIARGCQLSDMLGDVRSVWDTISAVQITDCKTGAVSYTVNDESTHDN